MISENSKKTIIGVIAGLVAMAVTLGWLTPEQAETVNDASIGLVEHIGGAILGLFAVWGIFTGKKE